MPNINRILKNQDQNIRNAGQKMQSDKYQIKEDKKANMIFDSGKGSLRGSLMETVGDLPKDNKGSK
jgi:hypothetical protein